jgi:1,2-dihydroxy-3-keto-5-methylthiopentene dioxygenase
MSQLHVYNDNNPATVLLTTSDPSEISMELGKVGVLFEQWEAGAQIGPSSTQDEILAAYASEIARLRAVGGYTTADVINMVPSHPDRLALRQKFLAEHQHSEDEVRFFVKGSGMFYLHLDGKVFAVQCTRGDLISVPANTRHWFDMGDAPEFTCVRLFTNPEGWVANYTGDTIAASFPRFEDLAA